MKMDRTYEMSGEVTFLCYGFWPVEEPEQRDVTREFFEIIEETFSELMPQKIEIYESRKMPFSYEKAKELWLGSKDNTVSYCLDYKNRYFDGHLTWITGKHSGAYNFRISFRIKTSLLTKRDNMNNFVPLVKKLFVWGGGFYGFVKDSGDRLAGWPNSGLSTETCIGDIGWITLFGSPYVKMFGEDILKSVPCKVEKLAENYYMLITADRPDLRDAERPNFISPELLQTQENVKNHLGRDAFDRRDPMPTTFTFEDIRAGKNNLLTPGHNAHQQPVQVAHEQPRGAPIVEKEQAAARVHAGGQTGR